MLQSPPSRRRGLKFLIVFVGGIAIGVASFSEAWIEIHFGMDNRTHEGVTSPPSRRRGLK